MKKTSPVSAAVFNFVFGIILLSLTAWLFSNVFSLILDYSNSLGLETILLLILFFPFTAIIHIFFLFAVIIIFIAAGVGIFSVIGGAFLIHSAQKANYKLVKKLALAQVIICSLIVCFVCFAFLAELRALRHNPSENFLIGFLFMAALFVAAIVTIITNSLCLSTNRLKPSPSVLQRSIISDMSERGRELVRLLENADVMKYVYSVEGKYLLQAGRIDEILDRCNSAQDAQGLIKNVFKTTLNVNVSPEDELIKSVYALKR